MIADSDILPVGSFGKPHGVNGEINLLTDCDIEALSCIVVDIDGINVPFFFDSVRPRGTESYLVVIDGFDSDKTVSCLVNKKVCALKSELHSLDVDNGEFDGDGFYADDLVGYDVTDADAGLSGVIEAVDDSTDNVLFVVRTIEGRKVLIPVADEFISEIDVEQRLLKLDLPLGILEL